MKLTATHKRRLRKLRAVMAAVPPRKIYLDDVFKPCGAPGCLLGWATVVFPRVFKRHIGLDSDGCLMIAHAAFSEGAEFFGADLGDISMFSSSSLTSKSGKREALERIDRMLAGERPLGD